MSSLIDENLFNNLNGTGAKLGHNSRKSLTNNNLSGFVNGINGNSSSTNSASTSSSSSSVASFSSGYESSMARKPPPQNNDLDHLFHPILAPSIYKTSSDLLYMTVKWTKSLPLFQNLNYKDQVGLFADRTLPDLKTN